MKSVKKANPVIMLDEIDKIGNSFHGDPASALLEVLDPEQNMSFSDHYLDVPFDLSKVMFIATANQLDTIPSALLDRMEVLRIAGYITKEKVKIAGKYLVPKQRKANGLSVDMVKFTDDALEKIIDGYARESESVPMKSESKGFKQSGQLGKVMVESSEIAYSYSVANAKRFGGKENFFKENYIHLHVPAGAVPKDGPSAGITMAVSLMSVVLNRPVAPRLGMTGELTLNGNVLPIGGLKEKVIAARRAGIQQIICPKDNRKDYEELPDYLKEELTFHFVESFDEVMKIFFAGKEKVRLPKPLERLPVSK
ncbi:hypothetical protein CHS0354_006928 [Potamilus streckersoni]|uniref:Lon proteolytic domain-containing protein n=1 Tax=Potamilus streckersoni TaxID=2493646 RepID=A0AAE0TEF6_9BIVA|nr:hypothetical protein CHS0354_006928 [Potamilus streckersoni]